MGYEGNRFRIKGDMTPPPGATMIGMHQTRLGAVPIFEEFEPVMVEQQRRDAAGKPMFHLNRAGQATNPVMETVPKLDKDGKPELRRRTFIQADLGNGVVSKNYDFLPTEQETERVAAIAQSAPEMVLARLDRLERGMKAAGIEPEELEAMAAAEEERRAGRTRSSAKA